MWLSMTEGGNDLREVVVTHPLADELEKLSNGVEHCFVHFFVLNIVYLHLYPESHCQFLHSLKQLDCQPPRFLLLLHI